jgi:outer membrane protein OmpA-like peptidoglycan-associated protein
MEQEHMLKQDSSSNEQNKRCASKLGLAFLLCLAVMTWCGTGWAQTNPTAFQLQQFRPSLDPHGLYQSSSAETMGQWGFVIGASFHYAWNPLFLSVEGGGGQRFDVITHQLGLDLTLGIGLLPFLDVVAIMPMSVYQEGKLPPLDILGTASNRDLSGFSQGDMKVRARLQALDQRKQGINLGFQVTLNVPTGVPDTFNGEDNIGFGIEGLLSRHFDRFEFAINFGYRYLPETTFLSLVIGHELTYSLGFAYSIFPKRFDVVADIHGVIGVSGGDRTSSPMGILAGIRVFPLGNRLVGIHFGLGIGLLKGYGSPGFRGFLSLVLHPHAGKYKRAAISDRDNDGIEDTADRCPGRPGPRSNNGCPQSDRDGDGIPDNVDRCPGQPGPKTTGGCPQTRVASGPDRDRDGTPDGVDKCPGVAGPRSNNGCPMPDSDGDGLADNVDLCPRRAGPATNRGCPIGVKVPARRVAAVPKPPGNLNNRDRDKDGIMDRRDRCPGLPGSRRRRGCPRRVLVKLSIRKRRIYIRRRVRFRSSTRMYRSTKAIFRQLARQMKSFPTMRIRLVGVTYSRSRRSWVRRRSFYRVRTIRRYLQRLGIAKRRIQILGLGRYRRRRSTVTVIRIYVRRF